MPPVKRICSASPKLCFWETANMVILSRQDNDHDVLLWTVAVVNTDRYTLTCNTRLLHSSQSTELLHVLAERALAALRPRTSQTLATAHSSSSYVARDREPAGRRRRGRCRRRLRRRIAGRAWREFQQSVVTGAVLH